MILETEQTEDHTDNGDDSEQQCYARTHQTTQRVGIAGNKNFTSFLGSSANTIFKRSVGVVGLQEDGTQGRTQCQGVQCGETDGNGHGKTELAVECTGCTTHETYRDEYGHHHQCNRDDGAAQFVHGVDRSCSGRFVTLVKLGMDTFDNHNGIIDHNGDGEHHS